MKQILDIKNYNQDRSMKDIGYFGISKGADNLSTNVNLLLIGEISNEMTCRL